MKIKYENKYKNMTNEYRYFLKSSFGGVNRLFVLIYLNRDSNIKRFKIRRYLSIKNCKVGTMEETFMTK